MAKRTETFMSPADLDAAGRYIFGDNWRGAMSDYLGCDLSLIYRYMTLKTPVPKTFAVAIEALQALKRAGAALPTVSSVKGAQEPVLAYAASQAKLAAPRTKRSGKELGARIKARRRGEKPG